MKKLSLTLCLILCLALLYGCAGQPAATAAATTAPAAQKTASAAPQATAAPQQSAQPSPTQEAPFVITAVGRAKPNYGGVENNKLLETIEAAANVKFEWEVPPTSNFIERLNIIMASGEYPDIIVCGIGNIREYAESGLLVALDEYMPDCPNITAMVPDYMFNLTRSYTDNLLYGIPVANPTFIQGAYWRMDWLKKAGITKVPETLDEFKQAWTYFATGDPDGNGQNDTYGFTTNESLSCTASLFPALGATRPMSWKADENGKVYFGLNDAEYIDALLFLKDMYAQGLLDPEYLLVSTEENHEQRFTQGYVGCEFQGPTVATWTRIKQAAEDAIAGCEVAYGYAPKGADGRFGAHADTTGSMGAWAITIGAEDPSRIMQFFDLMHTQEWYFTQANGVEGAHYESYDPATDVITRTEAQTAQWALDYNPQLWFSRDKSDLGFYSRTVTYKAEEFKTAFAYNNDETYYDLDISFGYIAPAMNQLEENMPDWQTTVTELQNKIVMNTGDTQTLVDFIGRLNAAGLTQATEQMQAYYDSNK